MKRHLPLVLLASLAAACTLAVSAANGTALASSPTPTPTPTPLSPLDPGTPLGPNPTSGDTCGGGANETAIHTSIDFGCKGSGNGIVDLGFALIRFISVGIGLVVIGSVIFAGIQYTTARGNPNQVLEARKRIRLTILVLFIYIFAFAIINYLVPGGFLK
jgi:hypothetical protein